MKNTAYTIKCSQHCKVIESSKCQRVEKRESVVGKISEKFHLMIIEVTNDVFEVTHRVVRLDIGENRPSGRLLMPLSLKSLKR